MITPKVLANTSIFGDLQFDSSYDASYSNAARDDASDLSFSDRSSPSAIDTAAQAQPPASSPDVGPDAVSIVAFQEDSIDAGLNLSAQHDVTVNIGNNDPDLSSVTPFVFAPGISSVEDVAATEAGHIANVLDQSALDPNFALNSDSITFVGSWSGDLTDATNAPVSSDWLNLPAGPEAAFGLTFNTNDASSTSAFAFPVAFQEAASPTSDVASPIPNLAAFQAPAPAPELAGQGGTSTLPEGIAVVGDLGAFPATLTYTNSSGLGGPSGGSSGSLQAVTGEQSSGLVINITWDSSVNSAPAAFKSVVESVVQFYESEFSNPITLNIDVGWGEVAGSAMGAGSLGTSISYVQSFDYSQILAALSQNVTSSAQLSAVSSLPASQPVNGSIYLTLAEATALGLTSGSSILDGAVGFNSSMPYAYTDTNGVPSGQYDLYGVVAHEISEVMGRISLLNYTNAYTGLDLFRYAANGVPSFTVGQTAYFSDNGGKTNFGNFNTISGGDPGDLNPTSGNAFNAFTYPGTVDPVTANDLTMLNVLGYDLASQTSQLPKVTAITETPNNGAATVGDLVNFTLSFSEAVTVSGAPTLSLNDNGIATYTGGSGTSSLSFSYTVGSNDNNVSELAATAITLNGGSIHDTTGYGVQLSLNVTQAGPQIETTNPLIPQIDSIYESVLQRAPTATEVTASTALDAAAGSTVMTAAIVDSAEAITNVYPIVQMFDLAFGHFPGVATLTSMVQSDLSVSQLSAAVVASQTFADVYNGGALIDPNSSVTGGIVSALYQQALGYPPAQSTLEAWLNSGLTVAEAFQEMVTSQSYFQATQNNIEQYLSDAVNNSFGGSAGSEANAMGSLTAKQIDGIYEAVLDRAPTSTEVTASQALDSATGDAATVATIVNSAEAISNAYPVLQMFELAFGHLPATATLASMVQSQLSVTQLSDAVVASQTFANTYNGGALMDPDSPVTASVVETLYTQALGHAPTQATLNSWLNSGLSTAEAFQEMVTSQSYFQTTQAGIQQYLTAAADNAISAYAGNVSADAAANVVGSTTATSEIFLPHPIA